MPIWNCNDREQAPGASQSEYQVDAFLLTAIAQLNVKAKIATEFACQQKMFVPFTTPRRPALSTPDPIHVEVDL
jgi:hypothetical protein